MVISFVFGVLIGIAVGIFLGLGAIGVGEAYGYLTKDTQGAR